MGSVFGLLWLVNVFLEGAQAQGVYAPPTVRIVHSGHACNVEEERYAERVYTIREGDTLELQCLVTGHPHPQVRWSKTAGGATERAAEYSVFNETLQIRGILRHQGGRYYCKAHNSLGSPAIKSIRVDVYFLDPPVITVHQSIGDSKEQFYFERTVFLRCAALSNPPLRYSWWRGGALLSQGTDTGVEIYEPFFTQGEIKILKLKNLRPQDYANYTCVSSVRSVCGIPDRTAHFYLSNRTAAPSIRIPGEDPLVVAPGNAVRLACVASGGEPPPSLTWVRGGEGEELPRHSALNRGSLSIPAVTVDDGGVYSCLATNNVGNPAKKSTTILVRGLRKARFWITPDPYHNDDHIQIGREVKVSCQVEATPPEELQFYWLKNGRPLRSSERMVITHQGEGGGGGDPAPGTTSLDIIDLKFTDFGTYTCVAALRSGGVQDVSIDVNISSTTVPPELSLPPGGDHLVAQEGDALELQCLVSGKPKPTVLWYRGDPEGAGPATPPGAALTESDDGILRIGNVTRDMSGNYCCQTSQYNGFYVKPRLQVITLVVQFPPSVEPAFQEVRQALGRAFTLSCRLLRAHPDHPLSYEWRLGERLLTQGQLAQQEPQTQYQVRALNREGYGQYTCHVTNQAGSGRCSFLVTGKAYPPEFYYDTPGALWQSRARVYGFRLQWTQMEPGAVDRIMAYRLGIRQVGQARWWEQEMAVTGAVQKGELLTYNLTELVKPEAYLLRLTPITRYGEGDAAQRTVTYSPPVNPHLREFHCGFEDESVCLFSQDKTEHFDWTRHSAATRDTKYTPNTGPSADHRGSKQGFYMYIETSRPRLEGDSARLLSPSFSTSPRGAAYCVSFFYHMYGKHIGSLGVILRQKGQTVMDSSVWSLSGNQGDRWRQAKVNIHPTATFQVLMEGVRGSGIEGDIAIDDITIEEGECKEPPPNGLAPPPFANMWQLSITLTLVLIGCRR